MVDINDHLREQCLAAFSKGDKEAAVELLEKVQQPQSIRNYDGWTLVHYAAKWSWPDICRTLIDKYHLDPTEKTKYGESPLHWACMEGRAKVVGYLLGLPTVLPTVNNEDDVGVSALVWACRYGRLSVVAMLTKLPSIRMPTEHLPSHQFSILSVLSSRMEWNSEFFIDPLFRVFMAGNTGAGKTTLTAAMQMLTKPSSSRHAVMVSGVKTLTAGICPTQCSR